MNKVYEIKVDGWYTLPFFVVFGLGVVKLVELAVLAFNKFM